MTRNEPFWTFGAIYWNSTRKTCPPWIHFLKSGGISYSPHNWSTASATTFNEIPIQVLSIVNVVKGPTIREMAEQLLNDGRAKPKITTDLQAEAETLNPSINPFPTRKGNTMSRFRLESTALLSPRVIFLTGATGYLGVYILAVYTPQKAIGQRLHLQNPQVPVPLQKVVEWLRHMG
jgi:hypothetical protein